MAGLTHRLIKSAEGAAVLVSKEEREERQCLLMHQLRLAWEFL